MFKKGVDRKHAEKLIRMKDDQQKGFFQYAFQGDNSDPALYDLIINTEKISWELATKLIVDLARSDEIKACSLTALATMRRMGLEKKDPCQFFGRRYYSEHDFYQGTRARGGGPEWLCR